MIWYYSWHALRYDRIAPVNNLRFLLQPRYFTPAASSDGRGTIHQVFRSSANHTPKINWIKINGANSYIRTSRSANKTEQANQYRLIFLCPSLVRRKKYVFSALYDVHGPWSYLSKDRKFDVDCKHLNYQNCNTRKLTSTSPLQRTVLIPVSGSIFVM